MTIPTNATAEQIIAELEADGYYWVIEHFRGITQCKIYKNFTVVGRYHAGYREPLADMLRGAIADMNNGGRNV